MNEYRFRGTRKHDGAPVESRMCARSEAELKSDLADYGIVLESAEVLGSANRSQTVSLGCGTLILIAIIVMFFSGGDNDVERELRQLKQEMRRVEKEIQAQTQLLKELRDRAQPPE